MPDENVAPSPTEETAEVAAEPNGETPAEAENSTETESAEAATPNGETEEQPEVKGPIPYDRFAEVIDERNREREERKALQDRIEALESGGKATPEAPAAELAEPPEHLSQREKVRWYIRRDAADLIKEELGMELGEAKALLQTVPAVSKSAAASQWEKACGKHGLDPNDKMVQNFTRGLVKNAGHSLDDALSAIKAFGGKSAPAAATPTKETPPPQRMNHDPSTGAMTGKATPIVFSKSEASKLAQRGERAPDAPALDILKAVSDRRAQR